MPKIKGESEWRLFDLEPNYEQGVAPDFVVLNKDKLGEILKEIAGQKKLIVLKNRVLAFKDCIVSGDGHQGGLFLTERTAATTTLRRDVLISELNQILEAHTAERAKYYLTRLERGIEKAKTGKVNDINLRRWKEYDEVMTDSLWVLPKRDTSGAHLGWYWGNFIPQIPHQLMLRYSKKGDWVLDLSNAESTQAFLEMFGEVVDNITPFLQKRRFLGLVIGDKYSKGEWIPLGFYCMNEVQRRGYSLKSIIVKNFDETRAKRDQKELWRYRALVGGFYIFKHEYVFVFEKS
jgi:hypothetical protein